LKVSRRGVEASDKESLKVCKQYVIKEKSIVIKDTIFLKV